MKLDSDDQDVILAYTLSRARVPNSGATHIHHLANGQRVYGKLYRDCQPRISPNSIRQPLRQLGERMKKYGYKCTQKDGTTFTNRYIVCFSKKDARKLMNDDKKIFSFCKDWEVIEL